MVLLSLACEEPMHPYRMQTLMKQRGKDRIANLAQRNSVYQTIAALRRAGLIEVRQTARDENRPERTIYAATEVGRRMLRSWIRSALATPAREFPEFPAAVATLCPDLTPKEMGGLLEKRVNALELRLAELERSVPRVPRLYLLESEYLAAIVRAEIRWLRGIIADLRSGRLAYPSEAELRRLAAVGGPTAEVIQRIVAAKGKPSPVQSQRAAKAAPGRRTRARSRLR
jgi:DNA-binding PadR family transcriptional regulator